MKRNIDIQKFLENLKIPHYDNSEFLEKKLRGELKNRIEEMEAKKKKILFYKTIVKYAMVAVFLFIISLFPIKLSLDNLSRKIQRVAIVDYTGDVYIQKRDSKNIKKVKNNVFLSLNDTIITKKDSQVKLRLGNNSIVTLNENSQFSVETIYDKDDFKNRDNKKNKSLINEHIVADLNVGSIECEVSLPTKNSHFTVITNLTSITVTGTKFSIDVKKDKSVNISVKRGSVAVYDYIKLPEESKKLDKDTANLIKDVVENKIMLTAGNAVNLEAKEVKKINNRIKNVVKEIIKDVEQAKEQKQKIDTKKYIAHIDNINQEISKQIIAKVVVEKSNVKLFTEESQSNTKQKTNSTNNIVKKIFTLNNTVLTEENTSITHDNRYLYITSDSNKSLYCFDTVTNKIKWQFTHKTLKVLTSPAIPFGKEVVLSTPTRVYVINKINGKLLKEYSIDNGTVFWETPVITKSSLYIPVSEGILLYTNDNFENINLNETLASQKYLSVNKNILFYNSITSKDITAYSIEKEIPYWTSSKLQSRSFMSPLTTDKYVFIADVKGNIYSFDISSGNTIKILQTDIGIVSNLINKAGKIYFIGTDGNFYQTKDSLDSQVKKITKINNKTDMNIYLVKKFVESGNKIYFSCDLGKIFCYDFVTQKFTFIDINRHRLPLVASPVLIDKSIYVIDTSFTIYKINKKVIRE